MESRCKHPTCGLCPQVYPLFHAQGPRPAKEDDISLFLMIYVHKYGLFNYLVNLFKRRLSITIIGTKKCKEALEMGRGKRFRWCTVFLGNIYWSRGILFAVCSNPKTQKPSCFFLSKKCLMLLTGTSTIGTHFSAVTLENEMLVNGLIRKHSSKPEMNLLYIC